jgi:hypothetical protein
MFVTFTISSNAFRTQEWSNVARDDVSRLRKTPPLVSFFGWSVGVYVQYNHMQVVLKGTCVMAP